MSTNVEDINGNDGAVSLLEELDKIFKVYARDLKTFRTGSGELELLSNKEMFDAVVKLLNVSDKIKKLAVPDVPENKPTGAKITNLQDFALNKNK